jgi:hypothetical protein
MHNPQILSRRQPCRQSECDAKNNPSILNSHWFLPLYFNEAFLHRAKHHLGFRFGSRDQPSGKSP